MGAIPMKHEEERRHATVLFADVSGFTAMSEKLDPEDVTAVMNRCFVLLEAAVRRYGGTVDKYIGDCVMAVFGVPAALEDAPRNAINAAIEMRKAIEDFNLQNPGPVPLAIHTGINTGLVLAGDVGGDTKREFTVMGDAVNLASRLKDASPKGSIWVGPETHRYTRGAFEFRTLKPIALKGKEQPVPVYEVRSVREVVYRTRAVSRRTISSALVGRDEELARLRAALRELAKGRGGVASIVGDAGLGKTRLTAEVLATPEANDVTVLQARSLSIGRALSFHPFVDMLRGWAGIVENEPSTVWLPKLETAIADCFGDEAAEAFPFIATLMGAPLTGRTQARVEGITGEAMDQLIRRSMKELLRRIAAGRPLALVFEDLHWADQSSSDLLESMLPLARECPILVFAVCRPDFHETSERILGAADRLYGEVHTAIRLRPLTQRHTRSLIDNLFKGGDLPSPIRVAIQERAEGNPFYVEEVIGGLIDEGAVVVHDGGLRVTDRIHTVSIPGTIREVITTRIDRLAERPKSVFQIASVFGKSFDRALLAEIVDDRDHLDDDLESLVDLQLLERTDVYSFKHALIQEVAYDSIPRKRREVLHGRVAGLIEAKHTDEHEVGDSVVPAHRASTMGVNGMLAYHFGLAGQPERAEHYLFKAGDEAARAAASNEALYFFREASELYLKIHGDKADRRKLALLQKNIALALSNRGQLIEAGTHFNEALECLGEDVPRRRIALVLRFVRTLAGVMWRIYVPWRVRGSKPATDADREVIATMFHRAKAQTTADPTRFLFDTMENLRRLVAVDPTTVPNAGGMYASTVGIFSYGGLSFRVGKRFLDLARPLVAAGDSRELFLYRFMNYLHHLLAGDWSEAHRIEDSLVQQNLRLGELWTTTSYLGLDFEQMIRQGRFADAKARMAEIRRIEETYGYDLAKSNCQYAATVLLVEQGDLEQALDSAEAYYADHQDQLMNVYALALLAKIQLLLGRIEDATASLARAEEIMRRAAPVPPFHLSSYLRSRLLLDLARLEVGSGDPRNATRTAEQALRAAQKVAWHRPEVLRMSGTVAWLRREPKLAAKYWSQSIAEAERLGCRPDLGRTYAEIARRLARMPAEARVAGLDAVAAVERARAIFAEAGLASDAATLSAIDRQGAEARDHALLRASSEAGS